jgi:hypothetical protein
MLYCCVSHLGNFFIFMLYCCVSHLGNSFIFKDKGIT